MTTGSDKINELIIAANALVTAATNKKGEFEGKLATVTTKANEVATQASDVATKASAVASQKTAVDTAKAAVDVSATAVTTAASTVASQKAAVDTATTTALAAKAAAEAARDSLNTTNKVFTAAEHTAGTSLTNTTSGQQFAVLSADLSFWIIYRNNSGVAQAMGPGTYTKTYLDSIFDPALSGRSGYSAAFYDPTSRSVWLGFKSNGKIDIGPVLDVVSVLQQAMIDSGTLVTLGALAQLMGQQNNRSGKLWSVQTGDGKLPIHVADNGDFFVRETNVSGLIRNGLESAFKPLKTALWLPGDSLTQGAASSANGTGNYPYQLQAISGRVTINDGLGGQSSQQISARAGGYPILVTATNNMLTTTGTVRLTSVPTNFLYSPATDTGANGTTPLVRSVPGTLAGVRGTLTKDATNAYYFARAADGAAVVVPPNTPFLIDNSVKNDLTTAFWMGTNDDKTTPAVTIANIQMAIDALPNPKRFLVLGLFPGFQASTAEKALIVEFNRQLAMKWPKNYVDTYYTLLYSYNSSNTQDVTDFNNLDVPTSRRGDTSIHLNDSGYGVIATAVNYSITTLGF